MSSITDYFKPENQAEKMNLKLLFLIEKTMKRSDRKISNLVKLIDVMDRSDNLSDAPGMYKVWKQIERQNLDKDFYVWLKKYIKERNKK